MSRISLKWRVVLTTMILLFVMLALFATITGISNSKTIDDIKMVEIADPNKPLKPSEMQEAIRITNAEKIKMELTKNSIYIMLGLVVLGGVLSYYMVDNALKPVKQLNKEIQEIKANSLDTRIALPKTKDEIYELSEKFNAMLENLESSFQKQKDFSHNVAHELRTPLASLQSGLEVFQLEDCHSNLEYQNIIQKTQQQTTKLMDTISSLLLFSKDLPIENATDVDLNQLIEDVVYELESKAQEKNIKVDLSLDDVVIKGDDALLERAIYNLIDNAIKYSANNLTVDCSLKASFDTVEFTLADNGVGILESDKEKIFEPFYRAENAKEVAFGNGIGLSVVKQIIEKHNGKIKVLDNENGGTIFKITFEV